MKKAIVIALMSVLSVAGMAQEDGGMQNKWKLAYGLMANVPSTEVVSTGVAPLGQAPVAVGNVELEWAHAVTRSLSLGLFSGGRMGGTEKAVAPEFGFNARVDILPMAGAADSRWSPYIMCKAGVWLHDAVRKEYAVGVGVDYFPLKHIGCFAEFQVGHYPASLMQYLLRCESLFQIGIVIRH